MEYPNQSNYISIPADVLYDTRLVMGAKVLYGEIVAITVDQDKTCTATNDYFAYLYSVTTRTIRRWITSLDKFGFITRSLTYDDYGNQIRYIEI